MAGQMHTRAAAPDRALGQQIQQRGGMQMTTWKRVRNGKRSAGRRDLSGDLLRPRVSKRHLIDHLLHPRVSKHAMMT